MTIKVGDIVRVNNVRERVGRVMNGRVGTVVEKRGSLGGGYDHLVQFSSYIRGGTHNGIGDDFNPTRFVRYHYTDELIKIDLE